jgi:hypothetical protein
LKFYQNDAEKQSNESKICPNDRKIYQNDRNKAAKFFKVEKWIVLITKLKIPLAKLLTAKSHQQVGLGC